MELILKLIVMISMFCFMGLAFRTNWREYKRYQEELRQEGRLASPRTRILRALKAYGILIGIALILTIVVFYVRKLEFKIPMILWGTLFFFGCECIIGGICGFIIDSIQAYKREGLIVTIIAVILTIGISVSIVYVRYNW